MKYRGTSINIILSYIVAHLRVTDSVYWLNYHVCIGCVYIVYNVPLYTMRFCGIPNPFVTLGSGEISGGRLRRTSMLPPNSELLHYLGGGTAMSSSGSFSEYVRSGPPTREFGILAVSPPLECLSIFIHTHSGR